MVNSLSNNFSSLYMQRSVGSSMSQSSSMSQGSSSHSDGVPFSNGGMITRVQNGNPSFGMPSAPCPQQGPSVQYPVIPNVASQTYAPMSFPQQGYSPYLGSQYIEAPSFLVPPDFSNSYGFVGHPGPPRQFPSSNSGNSNTGTRQYYGTRSNGNGTYKPPNGRGQTFGNIQSTGTWQTWAGNTEARTNIVPECQICSKRGHTTPNCWKRSTNPSSMGQVMECQICGKRGHSALDCHHRNNFAYQGSAPASSLSAMQAQAPQSFQAPQTFQASQSFLPNDSWIVDTRASHHMTADVQSL